MKTASTKGGHPLPGKTATAAKLVKITPERQIVEHLQAAVAGVHSLPLPTGKLGREALDCLELIDKFRTGYRDRVKQLLLKEPGAIPGWHVSEVPQRRLSCDTARVFDALSREDDTLTPERFLEGCTTNLTALRKLLAGQNPELSPDEIERELNRVLVGLIHYEMTVRLSRSKDRQLNLSL